MKNKKALNFYSNVFRHSDDETKNILTEFFGRLGAAIKIYSESGTLLKTYSNALKFEWLHHIGTGEVIEYQIDPSNNDQYLLSFSPTDIGWDYQKQSLVSLDEELKILQCRVFCVVGSEIIMRDRIVLAFRNSRSQKYADAQKKREIEAQQKSNQADLMSAMLKKKDLARVPRVVNIDNLPRISLSKRYKAGSKIVQFISEASIGMNDKRFSEVIGDYCVMIDKLNSIVDEFREKYGIKAKNKIK